MKEATVRNHARLLRRNCEAFTLADAVPDHLPHTPVRVGDLPALTLARIQASHCAAVLADALRQWVREGRPV